MVWMILLNLVFSEATFFPQQNLVSLHGSSEWPRGVSSTEILEVSRFPRRLHISFVNASATCLVSWLVIWLQWCTVRALPTQVGSPRLHVLNNEEPGSRPTSRQCSRVQVAPKLILPNLSCCFGNAQKRVSLHSEMVLLRRPGLLMTDSFYCQPASQQQTSGEKKKKTPQFLFFPFPMMLLSFPFHFYFKNLVVLNV